MSETPIIIDAPKYLRKEDEERERGPTKEEIEHKIDQIKKEFDEYRDITERIFEEWKKEEIDKTKNEAFNIVKKAAEEYESKAAEVNVKYNLKIAEATKEAEKITNKALEEVNIIQDEAAKNGYNKGKSEGSQEGYNWAKESAKKLNIILSTIARERAKFIFEARMQIIEIVVVMARKIVNALIETQPRVVYDNIMSVLKQLKGRAEIIIRVNGEDIAQVTKHKREFLQLIEGIEKIKITEDNTVDKGGCIIDTEYGSIDSRITTQMTKIERLIREILRKDITKKQP